MTDQPRPVPAPIPIALTLDHAPSVATSAHAAFDGARLDRAREQLQRAQIRHCTAFLVGRRACGHERSLERWLAAGYELGNAGYEGRTASSAGIDAFMADLERCDALLRSLGAFDDHRPRFFRFPLGDRGANATARHQLLHAIQELGYTIADVSVDFYDHCYETQHAHACASDRGRARAIELRYLSNVVGLVRRAGRVGRSRWGLRHVHIAACDLGPLNERTLPEALQRLAPLVAWKPLALAVFQPAYLRFHFDYERNGPIGEQLQRSLAHLALRPIARLSCKTRCFAQSALGPRWPHLTG